MKPKPLDLKMSLKPHLKFKWGNEEGFRNFKKGYEKGFSDAQEIVLNEIKQRIKQACEFYLKYKDKPELLIKEEPDLSEELVYMITRKLFGYKLSPEYLLNIFLRYGESYNEWLFKLAFRDVLESD